jgi:hypothetical protein
MAGRLFNSFTCPDCQALYHIVKVEAGPETVQGRPYHTARLISHRPLPPN